MASKRHIGSIFVDMVLGNVEFDKGAAQIKNKLKDLAKTSEKLGNTFSKAFTLPIVAAAGASVKAFANFDDKMTTSLAIMGKEAQSFRKQMEDVAKTVATTTTFSATQAAEAFYFLASAGLNVQQQMAALPQVAFFAQAGNFDLAKSTELLADAQSQLGLGSQDTAVHLANMARISDVLVGSANMANASVEQFAIALTRKAGAALADLNKPLEEGAAVLAAFADAGQKAERGSEILDSVLRKLPIAANENAKAFAALGIQVFDGSGKMRNLADIGTDFDRVLGALPDKYRAAAAKALGLNDNLLLGTSLLARNADKVREYQSRLEDMGGTTQDVADKQLKSFTKQLQLTWQQVDLLGIEIGGILSPHLLKLNGYIKDTVTWFRGLGDKTKEATMTFLGITAVVGPLLIGFAKVLAFFINAHPYIAAFTIIGATMAAAWVTYGDDIKKAWAQMTDQLSQSWNEWMQFFGETIATAEEYFNTFMLGWDVLSQEVGALVGVMTQVISEEWNKIIDSTRLLIEGVTDWLVNKFDSAIVDPVRKKVESITGFFQGMYEAVVGNSSVPDTIEGIKKEFGKLDEVMVKPTGKSTAEVIAYLDNTEKKTKKASKEITNALKSSTKAIEDLARKKGDVTDLQKAMESLLRSAPDDLVSRLKELRKDYEGSARSVDIFDDTLKEADRAVKDHAEKLKSMDERILDIAKVDRFPAITKAVQEAFSKRNSQSAEDFAGVLTKVRDELVKTEEQAEAFEEAMNKASNVGEDSFMKDLPDFLSKSISDAVIGGFNTGFNSESIKQGMDSVSRLFVNKFSNSFEKLFQPGGLNKDNLLGSATDLAGAWGMSYLSSAYGATNENGVPIRTDGATGALAGAASGASMGATFGPWGAAAGAVIGGVGGYLVSQQGMSSEGSISRAETQDWIESRLQSAYLPFLQEQGNLHYGDGRRWGDDDGGGFMGAISDFVRSDLGQGILAAATVGTSAWGGAAAMAYEDNSQQTYSPTPGMIQGADWTDQFWEMSGEVGQAFHSMGMVIEAFAGNAGENFGQLGVILWENLNGNLDNARLMMNTLGIDSEAYINKLVEIGVQGKFTWHEIEVALQRTEELTGKGMIGFGNLVGAVEQLRGSAGRGGVALTSLRNIMEEATDLGIENFGQLQEHMIAQGVSIEDVNIILTAFAQRGITSVEQLGTASDRTLGGVVADMESLGFGF